MVAEVERIEGTVARVNGNGFQLAGRPGWLNLSRFARPAPDLPASGERVAVSLDTRGYVRAVECLTAPLSDVPPEPQKESKTVSAPASSPDKEARIVRMNAVTNAIAVLSSDGRSVEVADVLRLAAQLEGWVNRCRPDGGKPSESQCGALAGHPERGASLAAYRHNSCRLRNES
jgi:hypothetical protein